MALFGETRQGFVVMGLLVLLVMDYYLPLPPHLAEREMPNWDIPPPPGRRGVACWMASGMGCCCYATDEAGPQEPGYIPN